MADATRIDWTPKNIAYLHNAVAHGLSHATIARNMGSTASAISSACQRFGATSRKHTELHMLDKRSIMESLEMGESVASIAEKLDWSESKVRRVIESNGLKSELAKSRIVAEEADILTESITRENRVAENTSREWKPADIAALTLLRHTLRIESIAQAFNRSVEDVQAKIDEL